MLGQTTVQLNATDYTKMTMGGSEKPNVAVRSTFESKLIETPVDGIRIRCSAQDGDYITIPRFAVNTLALNLYRAGAKTQEQADRTINLTKDALERLSLKRSTYGSMQNRLEYAYNIRSNIEENTTAAESRIRDTDIATEMVDYSNNNILEQAGVSVLSQANQSAQLILQLLQ
jgi:flagellin